jgi:hypothetical protein
MKINILQNNSKLELINYKNSYFFLLGILIQALINFINNCIKNWYFYNLTKLLDINIYQKLKSIVY